MRHKNIPVAQVTVPEVRVTAVYDEDLTKQLHDSLESTGQIQPIVVVEKDGSYELVDGLHRLEEAQKRGDQTIPAVLYEGSSADAMILNLVTNRLKGKTRASEMVRVIDHLVHNENMDSEQIAERTGFGRDYIEKLWKVSEAWEGVRQALDDEVVGVGVAFQLSRLPSPLQQEQVLPIVVQFRMRERDVKDQVDQILQEMQNITQEQAAPPPPPPPPPPEPHCDVCFSTPGIRLLSQVIMCPGCFGAAHERGRHQQAEAVSHVNGTDPP